MTKKEFISGSLFQAKEKPYMKLKFSPSTCVENQDKLGYIYEVYDSGYSKLHGICYLHDFNGSIIVNVMGQGIDVTFNYSDFELC